MRGYRALASREQHCLCFMAALCHSHSGTLHLRLSALSVCDVRHYYTGLCIVQFSMKECYEYCVVYMYTYVYTRTVVPRGAGA